MKRRISIAFGLLLLLIGAYFIVFGLVKGPVYGWFDEKAAFMLGDEALDLDGYSIVPLALEAGVLFVELAAIWFLTHPWHFSLPRRKKQVLAVHSTASMPAKPPVLQPEHFSSTSRGTGSMEDMAFSPTPSAAPAPYVSAPQAPIVGRRTMIEAKNVSKIYENGSDIAALENIDLVIREGESVAIVGKSGSGKSTLMHILATLDQPTSGDVIIDGIHVGDHTQRELDHLRNAKFGFVFQQFFLNAKNTCLENVTLPLTIMGVPSDQRTAQGLAILEAVGLKEFADQRAGSLSGGQKQRLCIARALVAGPKVVFADEPTGNLDSENGKRVVELLFKLQREKNITLVIVTHDSDLAALCGRSVVIRDGKILSITSQ